jgi:hypothetical protein
MATVAALFVSRKGPYWGRPDVDAWDEARDARNYAGPYPVVAHPPCGPWSKLRHLCTRQDVSCGPKAVEQVRAFRGLLEHPEHSQLWQFSRLPYPGELPDAWGGRTYRANQVDWGHVCSKPTWLYVVGIDPGYVQPLLDSAHGTGTPTHCVCTGPRQLQRLPVASRNLKNHTPPAFAELLISIARNARRAAESLGVVS